MAKAKETPFFCKECGFESPKWSGQCPSCKEWNTMVEAPAAPKTKGVMRKGIAAGIITGDAKPSTMAEVSAAEEERVRTDIGEFDRVLGGGIIKGSLVLVGGDPGIGKSTLLTQICKSLSDKGIDVLYISGEESLKQIKLRANRLGEFTPQMKLLCETDLNTIEEVIASEKPEVVVIDSIQTMYRQDVENAPGSASQVRECTNLLMQIAKGMGVTIFIVGHVTKEGVVAGPRMLEHMVDTVLYFEGESQGPYRILRGVKNRFGSTNEIGVFEMRSDGLREVKNPSEFMLLGRPEGASGSIVSCTLQGTRPILVEIQALITRSALSNPRRSATGMDYSRMYMLLAVLEKRLGFHLSECDAYINVVGGMKINETALDLAVIVAIASGYMDFVVDRQTMAIGEVGLAGEVRNVNMLEQRVKEAEKLGFNTCIVPKAGLKTLKNIKGIRIIGVENVKEAINTMKNALNESPNIV